MHIVFSTVTSMCTHSPFTVVKKSVLRAGHRYTAIMVAERCRVLFPCSLLRWSLSTLVACPLVIATVGCESGASGKLVGTSVELVAGGDSKVADCPLVAGRDVKSQLVP